jgi:hypothetical protein
MFMPRLSVHFQRDSEIVVHAMSPRKTTRVSFFTLPPLFLVFQEPLRPRVVVGRK